MSPEQRFLARLCYLPLQLWAHLCPFSTCHMRGCWADSKNSEVGLAQGCA